MSAAKSAFWEREFHTVAVAIRGRCLEVTINRPERHNALSGDAHQELHTLFDAFEADPDLWVAIITGAGDKAFCAGNDLKATQDAETVMPQSSGFAGLCFRDTRTKPVIAAVNGYAMGGGFEIVLACDMAIAVDGALFALPEVKLGLFAAAGGVQRMVQQTNPKLAMELVLTGRHFDAARALELGLINHVVPKGTLMDEARALADEITAAAPLSVRASKRLINEIAENPSKAEAWAASETRFEDMLETRDAKEGVAAFLEKRPPVWTAQ